MTVTLPGIYTILRTDGPWQIVLTIRLMRVKNIYHSSSSSLGNHHADKNGLYTSGYLYLLLSLLFSVFMRYCTLLSGAILFRIYLPLLMFIFTIAGGNAMSCPYNSSSYFTLHYENMPIQIYRKLHLQKLKIFR